MEIFEVKDCMFILFVFLLISFICFLSFRIQKNNLNITRELKQERVAK